MQETNIEALIQACKYSLIPNELGFCGPENSYKELLSFVQNPSLEKVQSIKQILQQFYALFPYLEIIADANNLSPFDAEVVESYWIGNDLLEKVEKRDLQRTIISFQRFGLPQNISEKKTAELPSKMFPHHSFHVLYINFINPKVPKIVENLSNCLVQWGEVKKAGAKPSVKGIELFAESGQLKLREKIKQIENPFEVELKKNDLVSVHWNKVVEKLSKDNFSNLRSFTLKNLTALQQ